MFREEHLLLIVVALLGLGAAVYAFARRRASRAAGRQSDTAGRAARRRATAQDLVQEPDSGAAKNQPAHGFLLVKQTSRAPGITRYPIVLAHGWFGFDAIALPGLRHDYFRGVPGYLKLHGQRVYVSRVAPIASIRRRAEQLAEQVDRTASEKVNIIAHSMGGLDARYAISRLGLASRVASLTTIGTPHHGTPLADTSLMFGNWQQVRRVLSGMGTDLEGIYDLTTQRMQLFNADTPDLSDVTYVSYVTWVRGGYRNVHTLLAPGFVYLRRRAGDNDGMVPASSQRWGSVVGELHADHWAQIGWSRGVDVRTFYRGVTRMLARRGF